MNKSGIRSFFIILFLVISSFFNVGSSSFVVEGEAKQENITINEGSKAVCYNARTGTKYTTIEKALSVAKDETAYNDTIYVIPGTNPTITSDCEIASGDTLCLPYEGETYKVDLNGKSTSDADFSKYYSGYFADENESNNLKSNVFILGKSAQETTTLTISGTLLIGGILGVGEGSYQKPTGHTMGSYSQVTLTKYSHIVNKGKIECRGYIKPIDIEAIDYCSLINESGSETNLPFVIYDYRGGSYSAACKLEGVFPFNVFDLPNCHVTSIYNSGSTLKVIIHASANNQIYSPDSNAILLSNNDGLFRLSSGSVSFQYKPAIFNRTTNDCVTTTTATNSNILNISIDGTISLSSMTITLAENSVNTADFYLPFSYKFNIDVKSGSNLNIENKVKFLSGSYLHINEGATVNTNASIVFYQVYNGRNTLSDKYPNSLGPSVLINDGEMNINSSFGGKIGTTLINAKINTGSSFSATTTSREVLTGSSGGLKRVIN